MQKKNTKQSEIKSLFKFANIMQGHIYYVYYI